MINYWIETVKKHAFEKKNLLPQTSDIVALFNVPLVLDSLFSFVFSNVLCDFTVRVCTLERLGVHSITRSLNFNLFAAFT